MQYAPKLKEDFYLLLEYQMTQKEKGARLVAIHL